MPFTHAIPRPDGGVDFTDASTGQKQTLYGQTAVSYAQRLPSLATSDQALADNGGGVAPPPVDQAAQNFVQQIPVVAAEEAAARAAPPQAHAPVESGAPVGGVQTGARSFADLEAKVAAGPSAGVSGSGGASGSGGKAIGVGDVGGAATTAGNPYQQLSNTLKLSAAHDLLRGSGGHKAGWVNQGESTSRKGTASEDTIKSINAAVDQSGEALGGKAEVARQSDVAQQQTYRAAAEKALQASQAIEASQQREVSAFQARAARLEAEAAKEDRNAPGLQGLLNRLRSSNETEDEGDALLMAANTGGSVADVLRAKTAARQAKGNKRDEADKALVEGAKAIRVGEVAKTEAYANYLASVLKAQESEYKALGREPELRAQLAELERRKAELKAEREAALQGDTTSTKRYREASTGGGAAAKLRAAEIIGSIGGANAGPSVLVGDQRVAVDPKLPDAARNEIYKQTDAQAMAEKALTDARKYHEQLGATDYAAYKAGVTTPAMAKYLSAVAERAAHTSVARGMGAQQDAERKDNEGRYLSIWGAEAHMEREAESDRANRIRLMRKASGRDPSKLWPIRSSRYANSLRPLPSRSRDRTDLSSPSPLTTLEMGS